MDNILWSNIILIIYCIAWIFFYLYQKRRTCHFGPCLFVILTYILYAVLSIILYKSEEGARYGELSFFPLLYLYIMLIIALMPGIKYERSGIKRIQMPSTLVLYTFFIVYGICTVATLPSAIANVRSGIFLILDDASAGEEIYKAARASSVSSDHVMSGIFGLFAIIHNFFRDISIFLLFYYLALKDRIKTLSIYLIIVLVLDIFLSIARGGRTTFMMILFAIGVAYFMFRMYWSDTQRGIIKRMIPVILVFVFIPFIALTASRFGSSGDASDVVDSMVNYAGMGNLNFDKYVFDSNGIRYGDRTANEFKRLLGYDVPNGIQETRAKYSGMSINDRKFYTFVGDFVLDYGSSISMLVFVLFSLIICGVTKTKDNTIPFHKLLLVYFSLCVCSQGGMYLFYYSFTRNWVIIAFLVMFFVFYIDCSLQRGNYKYIDIIDEENNTSKKIKFIFKH